MLGQRMEAAFGLALSAHGDQIRKGSGVPYLTHLLAVSGLVGEFGGDEDLMIAGLLHDTLEDCPHRVTRALLAERFGWRVMRVVVGCSDCFTLPKPPWEERKQAYLEHLSGESPDVKLVVAADKLHNATTLVRDVRREGNLVWRHFNASRDRQLWYLQSCIGALATGWDHQILLSLREVIGALAEASA